MLPEASWITAHMANAHNGVPSFGGGVDRTVRLGLDTRRVDVTQDEVVRFVAGNRAVDWRVATDSLTPIEPSRLAPAGFAAASNPTIHLAPNALYAGS